MSKELETKLRELRDRLMFEESDTANVMNLLDDCITLAASQQPPAGQVTVEPVAWMTDTGEVVTRKMLDKRTKYGASFYNIPLYAHPRTNEDAGGWIAIVESDLKVGERYLVADEDMRNVRGLYWTRTHSNGLVWTSGPNGGEVFGTGLFSYYAPLPSPRTKEDAGGWIPTSERLPEKRDKDYRVLAFSNKRYPEKCNYPNELKPGIYQDWNVRQWPDNFPYWRHIDFSIPSPPTK